MVDPRGITLSYRFQEGVLESLNPASPITGVVDQEKEQVKIDAIKNYTRIREGGSETEYSKLHF